MLLERLLLIPFSNSGFSEELCVSSGWSQGIEENLQNFTKTSSQKADTVFYSYEQVRDCATKWKQ